MAHSDQTVGDRLRLEMPFDSTMLASVTEAGTSTQAGFRYQNSMAALHVARMLDTRARNLRTRVTTVRFQAPAQVDDMVVHHADGASHHIQAKLDATSDGRALSKAF